MSRRNALRRYVSRYGYFYITLSRKGVYARFGTSSLAVFSGYLNKTEIRRHVVPSSPAIKTSFRKRFVKHIPGDARLEPEFNGFS